MLKKLMVPAVAALVLGLAPSAKSAPVVDLALVLATDVSGSVDAADFNLMRTGYVNAFQSAALQTAIQGGALGQIAVTLVYWSDTAVVAVPWTIISSGATANAFAAAINAAPRPGTVGTGTGMVNALEFSAAQFVGAPEATRQVIDVAGDGSEGNACTFSTAVCAPLQAARDAFLTSTNRTINALWVRDPGFFGTVAGDTINSLTYGSTNVIGGTGAFQSAVAGFADFQTAIQGKLIQETTPSPEPSTYALVGSVLLGLAALRRRR